MALPTATMQRLRTQLDCSPILMAGAAAGAMDRKPASGKWSARENLAHLARYEGIFLERVSRILTESDPVFPGYKAEEDAQWPQWSSLPSDEILKRLQAQRATMVERFTGLGDAELTRSGVHSRFGKLTLLQWLEFFLLHEAHHLLAVLQRMHERD